MVPEVDMSACTTDFSVRSDDERGGSLVTPLGAIDLENRDELRECLDAQDGDVVVDLAGVELLDAGGIGVLVATRNRLQLHGGSLMLRDPRPLVRATLEAVHLEDWIAA
jgi:anti-sigma B factor antagonist